MTFTRRVLVAGAIGLTASLGGVVVAVVIERVVVAWLLGVFFR